MILPFEVLYYCYKKNSDNELLLHFVEYKVLSKEDKKLKQRQEMNEIKKKYGLKVSS